MKKGWERTNEKREEHQHSIEEREQYTGTNKQTTDSNNNNNIILVVIFNANKNKNRAKLIENRMLLSAVDARRQVFGFPVPTHIDLICMYTPL